MQAFMWLLILLALGLAPAARAGHDHYGGGHIGLWLGLPPPVVAPGYFDGYPAYPRYRHHRHRHHHHHGDSDSDSDSGHRHHRGCH